MRIHTSATFATIADAARIARVDLVVSTEHKSRTHERAFEVKLEGESRRRPNGGSSGAGSGYAATWDQWGVFLSHIFDVDPNARCGSGDRPIYRDAGDFDWRTDGRFGGDTFPKDYHGDHVFRFEGTVGEQGCTKCSAVHRWMR